MKTNVKKVDKDGRESNDSKFWTYDVYCDVCGQHISSPTTVIMPNRNEKDYCPTCAVNTAKNS
jgi:ribosome-binding protein aMBF1 (putative translation factor)